MTENGFRLLVIVLYFVLLGAIGIVFKRFNKDTGDYFRNGCQASWWLVGASIAMASVSAWTFTGAAGAAYEAGWSVLIIYLGGPLALLFQAIWFAPRFRRLRAITVPEVLRDRFGPVTQQIYAYVQVLSQLIYGSIALYAISIFIAAFFGIRVELIVILLGTAVLVYSTTGGSWAVMAADYLQTMIVLPLSVLTAFLCLHKLGGVSGLFETINEMNLTDNFRLIKSPGEYPLNKYTAAWAAAMFALTFINSASLFNAVRYFAAKTCREASKAALFAAGLLLVGTFIWFIPPITARLLFADSVMAAPVSHPMEAAYAVASVKVLPFGLDALIAVAMIAATVSTIDTGLNRNVAIIIKDVLPAVFRTHHAMLDDRRRELLLSRVVTVVFALIMILLALHFAQNSQLGVFDIMQQFIAKLSMPMAIPLMLAVFVRRIPWWGCLFSLAVSLIGSLVGIAAAVFFDVVWSFQFQLVVNLSTGIGGFLLPGLWFNKASADYRDRVDRFFELMATPVDFEKEVGCSADRSQLLMMGSVLLVLAGLIALLLFVPNDSSGRWLIGGYSLFLAVVGAGQLIRSKKHM